MKMEAIAVYNFHGDSSAQQLSMDADDPLRIIERSEIGWFWGTNLRTSQTGWFPGSFARIQQRHHTHAPASRLESNKGFEGPAMGGGIRDAWAPKIEQPQQTFVPVQGTRAVTIVPVPEGPKPQNPVQQTSWIVTKTARRTGKVLSKASHKIGKSIFKQQHQHEEQEREIIAPRVRRTSEAEHLSAIQNVGGRGLWK